MQLRDRSGICCDLCGTSYRNDFTYYSYDFRMVEVYTNIRPSLDEIVASQPVSSLDVCQICFGNHKKAIIAANATPVRWLNRKQRPDVMCDLTGVSMLGTYTYYYNIVSKIDVKSQGNPYVCHGCNTVSNVAGTCKKCKGTTFSKQISANIDKRHVEYAVSDAAYQQMAATAKKFKETAGEWTSQS